MRLHVLVGLTGLIVHVSTQIRPNTLSLDQPLNLLLLNQFNFLPDHDYEKNNTFSDGLTAPLNHGQRGELRAPKSADTSKSFQPPSAGNSLAGDFVKVSPASDQLSGDSPLAEVTISGESINTHQRPTASAWRFDIVESNSSNSDELTVWKANRRADQMSSSLLKKQPSLDALQNYRLQNQIVSHISEPNFDRTPGQVLGKIPSELLNGRSPSEQILDARPFNNQLSSNQSPDAQLASSIAEVSLGIESRRGLKKRDNSNQPPRLPPLKPSNSPHKPLSHLTPHKTKVPFPPSPSNSSPIPTPSDSPPPASSSSPRPDDDLSSPPPTSNLSLLKNASFPVRPQNTSSLLSPPEHLDDQSKFDTDLFPHDNSDREAESKPQIAKNLGLAKRVASPDSLHLQHNKPSASDGNNNDLFSELTGLVNSPTEHCRKLPADKDKDARRLDSNGGDTENNPKESGEKFLGGAALRKDLTEARHRAD